MANGSLTYLDRLVQESGGGLPIPLPIGTFNPDVISPESGSEGQVLLVLSNGKVGFGDISITIDGFSGVLGVTNGGTGVGALVKGDILYADDLNHLARKAISSDGSVLHIASGLPTWTRDISIDTVAVTGVITSTLATGTAPLVITSTTKVANLNVDLLDDQSGAYYLDSDNFTGTEWVDLTDAGATTLHKHDHGGMDGLADDDHTQYVHITTARTITAVHTFDPTVVGAAFILGANATGQLITGLNADFLDSQSGAYYLAFANLTYTGLAAGQLLQATAATTAAFGTTFTGNYTWSGTQDINNLVTITKTTTQLSLRYSATELVTVTQGPTGTCAFAITTAGTKAYTFDATVKIASVAAGNLYVSVAAPTTEWGYLELRSGTSLFHIAIKSNDLSGALQFRPAASAANRTYMNQDGSWVMASTLTVKAITSTSTTQQLALHYNASNHLAVTVANDGGTTFNATGTDPEFIFSDKVTVPALIATGDLDHDGTNFGVLGATPAPQRAHQADATDLATAITAVNYALATLETFGYHATA